jgi:hypothetical protein
MLYLLGIYTIIKEHKNTYIRDIKLEIRRKSRALFVEIFVLFCFFLQIKTLTNNLNTKYS